MESHFNINIPDHGMATMTLSRVKKSKQWITILFGCNADGSEKLPLFFIGKAASHGVSKRSEKNLASTIETTKKHGWQQYCLKSKDIWSCHHPFISGHHYTIGWHILCPNCCWISPSLSLCICQVSITLFTPHDPVLLHFIILSLTLCHMCGWTSPGL